MLQKVDILIEVGSVPFGEKHITANQDEDRSHAECVAYKKQLMRMLRTKVLPHNFSLTVRGFSDSFETCYEVSCKFDGNNKSCWDMFEYIENNLPEKWDKEAIEELSCEL